MGLEKRPAGDTFAEEAGRFLSCVPGPAERLDLVEVGRLAEQARLRCAGINDAELWRLNIAFEELRQHSDPNEYPKAKAGVVGEVIRDLVRARGLNDREMPIPEGRRRKYGGYNLPDLE